MSALPNPIEMSAKSPLRRRWLSLGGLFVLSLAVLFLGLYRNQWNVVHEKKFKEFQLDSESLVIARMVESRQSSLISENGLLGWGDADPQNLNESDYLHQYDVYLAGQRFQSYSLYKSVSGFQGLLFSALDGLSPATPSINLRDFRVLVALLFALSLSIFVIWVFREFGWVSALFVVVTTMVSQWITLFGHNLFYFIGASFLPLGLMAFYLDREQRTGRASNLGLGLVAFGTVFFKCLMNGYDFIIPALSMPVVPLLYYGIRMSWDRTTFAKRLAVLCLALLMAVVASMIILAAQLQVSEGSLLGGFASLFSTFGRRTYADPNSFPFYAESLRANPWSVLWTYIADDTAIEVLGLRFLDIIMIFGAATAVYLILDAALRRKLPDRNKAYALIAATWLSILSPISWFLIFKGQAYVHTHTNYLAWHMPFTLFGYAMCGFVIHSVLRAPRFPRSVRADPPPVRTP